MPLKPALEVEQAPKPLLAPTDALPLFCMVADEAELSDAFEVFCQGLAMPPFPLPFTVEGPFRCVPFEFALFGRSSSDAEEMVEVVESADATEPTSALCCMRFSFWESSFIRSPPIAGSVAPRSEEPAEPWDWASAGFAGGRGQPLALAET